MRKTRGLVGMDALILTIAIILVAMVVTYAYVNTTTTLMIHDQNVVREKQKGMQKPVVLEQVRAMDTDNDKRIDLLITLISQRHGDDAFIFNRTVVIYNSRAVNCSSLSYGPDATENCTYNLRYVKQGRDWEQDYMHSGDIIEIRFSGPNLIPGREDLSSTLLILPDDSMPTKATFDFPARISPQNMQLWPLLD